MYHAEKIYNAVSNGINKALLAVFGGRNQRMLDEMRPIVKEINRLEDKINGLSQEQLIAKTKEFQKIIRENYESIDSKYDENTNCKDRQKEKKEFLKNYLDEILPEAYAMVKVAAKRTLKDKIKNFESIYDEQLMGGIALHQGKLSEMATGEGKTLVATLPAFLNALSGESVHIMTANEYLAVRDRNWMGPLYEYLGLTVGVIKTENPKNDLEIKLAKKDKKIAYACDITYGKCDRFGFDYLEDNTEWSKEKQVQRGFGFAILDEVDSLLIDEARTPLILSAPAKNTKTLRVKNYNSEAAIARDIADKLIRGQIIKTDSGEEYTEDYIPKEKEQRIVITEQGEEKAESELSKLLGRKIDFYEENTNNLYWRHLIQQALVAKEYYCKDSQFVVKNGELTLVSEHTGRLMPGRTWSDGLQQAIEARNEKDGIKVQKESKTLASVTLQHFFKIYSKIAGMTGTAMTEAHEFDKIYNLDTISIPTHKPLIRKNQEIRVYDRKEDKWNAIIEKILEVHQRGQPILVGTKDIKTTEYISRLLQAKGLNDHTVLNANSTAQQEAEIIAKAGQKNVVTIATNMAGRGTDIVLGEGVIDSIAYNQIAENNRQAIELLKKYDMNFSELEQEAKRQLKIAEKHYGKKIDTENFDVKLGGLYVLGTEIYESRRIGNQLRGRAGRQGDPGISRVIISLEDELLKRFMPTWMKNTLLKETGAEVIQEIIENINFQVRENLAKLYEIDDLQRKRIYQIRQQAVEKNDLENLLLGLFNQKIENAVDTKDDSAIINCMKDFAIQMNEEQLQKIPPKRRSEILQKAVKIIYERIKASENGLFDETQKRFILEEIDENWPQFIQQMDDVKDNIGLRGCGNIDPKIAYQMEAHSAFNEMMGEMVDDMAAIFFWRN